MRSFLLEIDESTKDSKPHRNRARFNFGGDVVVRSSGAVNPVPELFQEEFSVHQPAQASDANVEQGNFYSTLKCKMDEVL